MDGIYSYDVMVVETVVASYNDGVLKLTYFGYAGIVAGGVIKPGSPGIPGIAV